MHNLKVLENCGVKSDLTARTDLLEGSQKKKSQLSLHLEDFLVSSPRNTFIAFQSQFLRFISMREACPGILVSYMNTYYLFVQKLCYFEKNILILKKGFKNWETEMLILTE